MRFKYQARTKTGELQAGVVEAANKEAALNILSSHELYILSIESTEHFFWYERILRFFERVKQVDLMIFTRQFAVLMEAKVPLSDSLKSLYKQTTNPILKEVVFGIISDIDTGLSLSQALDRHTNIFSVFYINMIRSAEVSGRLEESMSFLADYLEKESGLSSRVRNALLYPAFILVFFVIIAIVLIVFVFPSLKPIFEEADVNLPILTRILLNGGDFILSWWWALLAIIFLFGFLLIDYFQTEEGHAILDEVKIHTPVIGKFARQLYISRFAASISVLIKGGIPIAQAIEISGHTVGNAIFRDVLKEAAEGVRRGELLSQILNRSVYFPPLVSQMVAIGETTGRLDELLDKISSFYAREVDIATSNLVELIQPTLMVIMGVGVGLIFASVLLPIYDLAKAY